MKERPILFSGPMVRAILEGRKTMTRRVFDAPSWFTGDKFITVRNVNGHECRMDIVCNIFTGHQSLCKYGEPGDRLWVKETWMDGQDDFGNGHGKPLYRASWGNTQNGYRWCPSIFMPRWASRIDLEITGVRVERLQDISNEDAIAEGVQGLEKMLAGGTETREPDSGVEHALISNPVTAFSFLWESINGWESWDANPWVWVVEFRRITP